MELVAKSNRNPNEFALRSLGFGGTTTLAAQGGISDRMIGKKGGGGSMRYERIRTLPYLEVEDSIRVSIKLVVASQGKD